MTSGSRDVHGPSCTCGLGGWRDDCRDVVILGSTGSIGTQALDLVRANPDRFRVVGADRGRLATPSCSTRRSRSSRPAFARPRRGRLDVEAAGRPCDVVLNGITGAVGLRPTLAALDAGNTLALANKESLIIGGPLVIERAKPGQIVPVDSEHSALAQCLRGGSRRRGTPAGADRERRAVPRPDPRASSPTSPSSEALAHPTWDMGPVVTINSATLVNKGLEVIEAHLLFGIPFDRIEVVVHPTSVVHSMVEFVDGSTLVQASPPTMLIPIALGLAWPDRVPDAAPAGRLDAGRRPGSSSRSTTRRSRRSRWPARPATRAARPRRSTTPPTRCASRRSATGGWRSSTSCRRSPPCSRDHDVPSEEHADRRRRPRRRRVGPREAARVADADQKGPA